MCPHTFVRIVYKHAFKQNVLRELIFMDRFVVGRGHLILEYNEYKI